MAQDANTHEEQPLLLKPWLKRESVRFRVRLNAASSVNEKDLMAAINHALDEAGTGAKISMVSAQALSLDDGGPSPRYCVKPEDGECLNIHSLRLTQTGRTLVLEEQAHVTAPRLPKEPSPFVKKPSPVGTIVYFAILVLIGFASFSKIGFLTIGLALSNSESSNAFLSIIGVGLLIGLFPLLVFISNRNEAVENNARVADEISSWNNAWWEWDKMTLVPACDPGSKENLIMNDVREVIAQALAEITGAEVTQDSETVPLATIRQLAEAKRLAAIPVDPNA